MFDHIFPELSQFILVPVRLECLTCNSLEAKKLSLKVSLDIFIEIVFHK